MNSLIIIKIWFDHSIINRVLINCDWLIDISLNSFSYWLSQNQSPSSFLLLFYYNFVKFYELRIMFLKEIITKAKGLEEEDQYRRRKESFITAF